MRGPTGAGLALVAALLLPPARAMSFDVQPPYAFLGGAVVREDWDSWQALMALHAADIRVVVLHQSGGGDALAGRRIAADLRTRGLHTVVVGRCSSACANLFLAGVERQFAPPLPGLQHVLGFHGSYNKRTQELNRRRGPDFFVEMTGGKMDAAFVERFIRLENKSGLMRFFHRDQAPPLARASTQLCSGEEERSERDAQCEPLPEVDALEKGVVTRWETREVPLPAKPEAGKVSVRRWER